MSFGRTIGIALLALGFAAPAGAGVRLYSGEIIVHTRGADLFGDFIGIPFGHHCNMRMYDNTVSPATHSSIYHAQHTLMFYQSAKTYTLTIPKFGGQIPVIDTNGDSVPDVPSGCAPASRQAGRPLKGVGSLTTTGITTTTRTAANPRGFSIPKSGLSRVTSGASLPSTTWVPLYQYTFPFNFEIEDADLRNDAGDFAKGSGPGSFTVSRSLASTAKVRVKAGANRFGGTMRLLGHYFTNRGIESGNLGFSTSVGATPWNLQYLGASAFTAMSVVTRGYTKKTTISRAYHYPLPNPGKFGYSARVATVSAFPWTTGTAEVTAISGPQSTILKRTGYDNRTSNGKGTIQMVSPMLTRWQNAFGDYHTGSIGVMRLKFVPEPQAWRMLAAGICAVALLYRTSRHRGSAQ
jgi:hypothetical protein